MRYHADPDKTKSAYLAPGVFTLGDIGYVDADGYIFITDRAADVVVSGGVNLYPAESEAVLRRHPAVAEVAVIGVPDPDFGESLRALVVATGDAHRPRNSTASAATGLAAYKCPKSYEFVPELNATRWASSTNARCAAPTRHSERTIGAEPGHRTRRPTAHRHRPPAAGIRQPAHDDLRPRTTGPAMTELLLIRHGPPPWPACPTRGCRRRAPPRRCASPPVWGTEDVDRLYHQPFRLRPRDGWHP
ncbi:AMP-binding enzyme [Streptomyces stelliscabiei]|uniref:AMP-binding enzyme n=1 Tax=Streptomyces stelliscabiei TaxID=146820 RepID=UPI002FF0C061